MGNLSIAVLHFPSLCCFADAVKVSRRMMCCFAGTAVSEHLKLRVHSDIFN